MATEIPDRVDPSDTGRGGGLPEEGGGQRPERGEKRQHACGHEAERDQRRHHVGTDEHQPDQPCRRHEQRARHMLMPRAGAVGARAGPHHDDAGGAPRDHAEQSDLQVLRLADAQLLHDGRHPEAHAIQRERAGQIHERQHPHAAAAQRLRRTSRGDARGAVRDAVRGRVLLGELRGNRVALLRGEPRCLRGSVGQQAPDADAGDHRRDRFEHEQPSPSAPATHAISVLHDGARHGGPDHVGGGDGGHEQRHGAGALGGGKPVGEIENDAREESGFRDAEQKAQRIKPELKRCDTEERWQRSPGNAVHEREGAGNDRPGEHDAGNPPARPELLEGEVAGHFKEEVAEKENAGAESVHRVGEAEGGGHLQFGEANIDAVEERHDVAHEQQRQQSTRGDGEAGFSDVHRGMVGVKFASSAPHAS